MSVQFQQPHGAPSATVRIQPVGGLQGQQNQWADKPNAHPSIPHGLEYLAHVDTLMVNQMVEALEIITGWETNNKYRIFNSAGQQCYYAFEKSTTCQRQCCGPDREFFMHVVDNTGAEIIRIYRPFKCCASPCCAYSVSCQEEIVVESPPGNPVGYAFSQRFCCYPRFVVLDAARVPIFTIEGPYVCGTCCPGDHDFNVLDANSQQPVGRITKKWAGAAQEIFTDATNFGISFPREMDVQKKATMLGVLFLIDFMFFETSGDYHSD